MTHRRVEPGVRRGVGRSGEYAFCWHGQSERICSDWVAIDPGKTYELSGCFKAERGVLEGIRFGVTMADAQQCEIRHMNVFSLKGTRTELAAPCQADDRLLYLKDASGWKAGTGFAAAFGAEENNLTFEVTPAGIKEIKRDGDKWVVVLNNPCGLKLPADTPVVENRAGGNGIFLTNACGASPSEWMEYKGVIGPKQWWPGAAYVRVVIVGFGLRSKPETPMLLMDDFSSLASHRKQKSVGIIPGVIT